MIRIISNYKIEFITVLLFVLYFYFNISQYITPSIAMSILILSVSYELYTSNKRQIPQKEVLLLPTNNDFENMTGNSIFGVLILITALGFLFFSESQILNSSLGVILGLLLVIKSRYKSKSLFIKISESTFSYEMGKIKKSYLADDILKVFISDKEIVLSIKGDITHTISFLHLEKNEINHAKRFFSFHLSNNIQ